jgi:DNA-binding HxlR family transcriptional regulator
VAAKATRPRSDSVRRTLELFDEPWTFLVLREAFFGVRRFDAFQRNLGLSRAMLAKRLRGLVELGIFERRLYQHRPDRYEYRLTEMGRELYPVFIAMLQWGDCWLEPDAETAAIVLRHATCGHVAHPTMVCDHCGETIRAREMAYEIADGSPSAAGRPPEQG